MGFGNSDDPSQPVIYLVRNKISHFSIIYKENQKSNLVVVMNNGETFCFENVDDKIVKKFIKNV